MSWCNYACHLNLIYEIVLDFLSFLTYTRMNNELDVICLSYQLVQYLASCSCILSKLTIFSLKRFVLQQFTVGKHTQHCHVSVVAREQTQNEIQLVTPVIKLIINTSHCGAGLAQTRNRVYTCSRVQIAVKVTGHLTCMKYSLNELAHLHTDSPAETPTLHNSCQHMLLFHCGQIIVMLGSLV